MCVRSCYFNLPGARDAKGSAPEKILNREGNLKLACVGSENGPGSVMTVGAEGSKGAQTFGGAWWIH